MNTNILSKCVEELKKETPNISYVLGMLETVIDMNGASAPLVPFTPSYPSIPYPMGIPVYSGGSGPQSTNVPYVLTDEEITAQRYAGGTVGAI